MKYSKRIVITLIVVCSLVTIFAKTDRPKKGSVQIGSDEKVSEQLIQAQNTSRAFIEISKKVNPVVVSVFTEKTEKYQEQQNPFPDWFFGIPFDQQPNQQQQQKPKEKEYKP